MSMDSDFPGPEPGDRDAGDGFADVFNSFSLNSRRRSRRRKEPPPPAEQSRQAPPPVAEPEIPQEPEFPAADSVPAEPQPEPAGEHQSSDLAAGVRAYTWTGGRTKSDFVFELETLVSTNDQTIQMARQLPEEHYAVVTMCQHPRSVAEIAATLSVPLGVAKVLVGDMAERGLVHVHQTNTPVGGGQQPSFTLMERVLSGLRRL